MTTQTNEMYRKVFIKTEADLPKEDGMYYAAKKESKKSSGIKPTLFTTIPSTKKRWLTEIEWYLIEQSEAQSKEEMQLFMDDIHQWADSAFGTERTALAPLHHLKKEVDEAIEAMQTKASDETIEELADCFILILNSSSKYHLTFKQLFDCAKWKMEKNKNRKWGKPDENGVCLHVKDQPQEAKQTRTTEFCVCPDPDREPGYSYCMRCHKHVSSQRMDRIIEQQEAEEYRREGLSSEPKCKSCGESISGYCERCQHLWET